MAPKSSPRVACKRLSQIPSRQVPVVFTPITVQVAYALETFCVPFRAASRLFPISDFYKAVNFLSKIDISSYSHAVNTSQGRVFASLRRPSLGIMVPYYSFFPILLLPINLITALPGPAWDSDIPVFNTRITLSPSQSVAEAQRYNSWTASVAANARVTSAAAASQSAAAKASAAQVAAAQASAAQVAAAQASASRVAASQVSAAQAAAAVAAAANYTPPSVYESNGIPGSDWRATPYNIDNAPAFNADNCAAVYADICAKLVASNDGSGTRDAWVWSSSPSGGCSAGYYYPTTAKGTAFVAPTVDTCAGDTTGVFAQIQHTCVPTDKHGSQWTAASINVADKEQVDSSYVSYVLASTQDTDLTGAIVS